MTGNIKKGISIEDTFRTKVSAFSHTKINYFLKKIKQTREKITVIIIHTVL